MTTEEKAKILVGYEIDTPRNLMRLEARDEYDNLLSMAEWKDQQFKEYLEKKLDFLKGRAMVPERNLLEEIINELFKED